MKKRKIISIALTALALTALCGLTAFAATPTGDYEIEYDSVAELEAAGVTAVQMEGEESVELRTERLASHGIDGYPQESVFYLSGKGYAVIEVPEDTVLDSFWADFFRWGADRCRVYVSADAQKWDRVYATKTEKLTGWSQDKTMSPVERKTFGELGSENRYRYVRIEFPRYQQDDSIGRFGYHIISHNDLPKWGTSTIRYDTLPELQSQVVDIVMTEQVDKTTGVPGPTVNGKFAYRGMKDYAQSELFWFEVGAGYITLAAPDDTYFIDFWMDGFKNGDTRLSLAASADGEAFTQIERSDMQELAPLSDDTQMWFTPVNKLFYNNLGSENKYKYLRIYFNADWYAAIGQFGYTWIDENTTEAEINRDEKPDEKPADTQQPTAEFEDLDSSFWGYAGIKRLYDKGIVKGDGAKVYPNANITREEAAVVLVSALSLTDGEPVTDATVSDWAKAAVGAAKASGLLVGDENGVINGKDNMTREQAAAVLKKAFAVPDGEADYPDADSTSPWAKSAVESLCAAGYMKGDEAGRVNPGNNITRAEFFVLLDKMLNK